MGQVLHGSATTTERYDCEYKRNGTANLFVFLDAHRSWRKVKVTDRRAASDFAHCMRDLADIHYPDAERIRVVLDNLSTHSSAALFRVLTPSSMPTIDASVAALDPEIVLEERHVCRNHFWDLSFGSPDQMRVYEGNGLANHPLTSGFS